MQMMSLCKNGKDITIPCINVLGVMTMLKTKESMRMGAAIQAITWDGMQDMEI